jgi:hypothetical protein
MEPTKPLFEVGETVILQPLDQTCTNLCGTETDVLYRIWGFYSDHRGVRKWRWGYVTHKMPPGYYVNDEGEKREYLGWCEENLRKKCQAGTNFTELLAALKEDVPVEHIECLPMKERQKPTEHASRFPETVKMIQPR